MVKRAWVKNGWRTTTADQIVKRGKNKGKVRVTLAYHRGRTKIVMPAQIREITSAPNSCLSN